MEVLFSSCQFIFLIKDPRVFDGEENLFSKIRNREKKKNASFLNDASKGRNISIAINYFLIAYIPLPAPYPHAEWHH